MIIKEQFVDSIIVFTVESWLYLLDEYAPSVEWNWHNKNKNISVETCRKNLIKMSWVLKFILMSFIIQKISSTEVSFLFNPNNDDDNGKFEEMNIVKIATNTELDFSQVCTLKILIVETGSYHWKKNVEQTWFFWSVKIPSTERYEKSC